MAQLRSELLKHGSTQTGLGLLAAMVGLVLLAVLLHGFGLPADNVDGASEQLMVLGLGEVIATVFAGLLGALSITGEIRHGTIRPTFLFTPRRGRVVAAKVVAGMLIGLAFGLLAMVVAAGVGSAALAQRGLEIRLDGGDYALLVAGGIAGAGLWAAIGVGVGALVRNQVPTLIGICAWLLFVEGLLVGDVAGVGDVGRFAPGAAAAAISGQDPETLVSPEAGLVLLVLYAAAAALAGLLATVRRDVV